MHEANTPKISNNYGKSVNIPSFGGLLAELQARISRSCRFCCFFASCVACIPNFLHVHNLHCPHNGLNVGLKCLHLFIIFYE